MRHLRFNAASRYNLFGWSHSSAIALRVVMGGWNLPAASLYPWQKFDTSSRVFIKGHLLGSPRKPHSICTRSKSFLSGLAFNTGHSRYSNPTWRGLTRKSYSEMSLTRCLRRMYSTLVTLTPL